MTEITQIATYLAGIFNNYVKKYSITNAEYITEASRGDKNILGYEYSISGGLSNNSTSSTAINDYNLAYNYWIDLSKSYAKDSVNNEFIPLVGNGISVKISNGNILVTTTDDNSNFDIAKIVINYIK